MKFTNAIAIFWLHFIPLVFAGTTNWTKPNGQLPSFTDSYTVGEKIILSWVTLNDSLNDLWLTRYNTSTDDFALRIAVSQDISRAGSYEWQIAINTQEVLQDTRFMLQFLPIGAAYNPDAVLSLPSPAFNLMLVNQQSPPNGTVSYTSSTSSSSSSTTLAGIATSSQTTASTSTATAQQSTHKSGGINLGTGATIGIIAGCTAVAIMIISVGLYCLILFKRQRRHAASLHGAAEKDAGPYEILGDRTHPTELSSRDSGIHELSKNAMIHELGNIHKKPGLHEMPG